MKGAVSPTLWFHNSGPDVNGKNVGGVGFLHSDSLICRSFNPVSQSDIDRLVFEEAVLNS